MKTDYHGKRIVKSGDEKREDGTHRIRIKGIVIPVDWDENGNVVASAVNTLDEDQYLIDKDEKGQELLSLIREEVELSGVMREDQDNKIITVKKYNLKKV